MEEQRKMKPLQKKDFGKTSKGELATVYTLENEAGMQISVSDFGATLTSVLVPDKDNNLVDLIAADPAFGLTKEQIEANLKPELYVGRAPRQVEVFLRDVVRPVLDAHKEELGVTAEINV